MDRNETARVLGTIKIAYPSSFKGMTDTDIGMLMELWTRQFADFQYSEVMNALDAIISSDTSDFYPNIAKIKSMIVKLRGMQNGGELSEQEAWNMVRRAIRKGEWYAAEEFDKFPKIIQQVVGSPQQLTDWGRMESETVGSVVASNFQRSYRARAASAREFEAFPQTIKMQITQNNVKYLE